MSTGGRDPYDPQGGSGSYGSGPDHSHPVYGAGSEEPTRVFGVSPEEPTLVYGRGELSSSSPFDTGAETSGSSHMIPAPEESLPSGGPYGPGPFGAGASGSAAYGSDPYGSAPYGSSPAGQGSGYGLPAYGASAPQSYPAAGQGIDPYGAAAYGASTYGAAGYGGYGQPPAYRPTNAMAIVALVCGLAGLFTGISALAGIICGHIARSQIARTGEQGGGMALTGLIIGYVVTIGWLLYFGLMIVLFIFLGAGSLAAAGA
ncbi:DUF4190 domain-containing protein [Brevibacterium album]|uniref:DUF4190 domain-containing protein n=1 Tax=Brevibacterium album TaxID=417948 RepID=UPI00042007FF|nr:DUF4190 domain-containing protein [Brevibacterium album]